MPKPPPSHALLVTLDVPAGMIRLVWRRAGEETPFAEGHLKPAEISAFIAFRALEWRIETLGLVGEDHCGESGMSAHALIKRIRKRLPEGVDAPMDVHLRVDRPLGEARPDAAWPLLHESDADAGWRLLGRITSLFAQFVSDNGASRSDPSQLACIACHRLAALLLKVPPHPDTLGADRFWNLQVCFETIDLATVFEWRGRDDDVVRFRGTVTCTAPGTLRWRLTNADGQDESSMVTGPSERELTNALATWLETHRVVATGVRTFRREARGHPGGTDGMVEWTHDPKVSPTIAWIAGIKAMAEAWFQRHPPPLKRLSSPLEMRSNDFWMEEAERQRRRAAKDREQEERRQEAVKRHAEERRQRMERAAAAAKARERVTLKRPESTPATKRAALPVPPVRISVKLPGIEFQDTTLPVNDLTSLQLKERAALWWVSNQSDDLLCLPNCRIQRLDYQVRTALRVLGPLKGRALLSDEVGLGKTIEAGIVLKELITRGMARRFLVLTLPSLVDQWAEELSDKFGLTVRTTNERAVKEDPAQFWSSKGGVVASLHTLKQPAHLEHARQTPWDALVVDEAHYLRNRASQAWQAVNLLPRQYLMLLTATPVQNSLEELYNLVTLLQPGQFPSPKEFRARFIDPDRPRQPREPQELRRLLGQIMIRNTRANAGIVLPPRHAETVLVALGDGERVFWQSWEDEFRTSLATLGASASKLWGRLLLQAAGSSPAAWREALKKFPDRVRAEAWLRGASLETSWRRKCELVLPLTREPGGAVIFTQFLETQAALAESLRVAGAEVRVIHGSTPAPERQPITDDFRRHGGALLLTHSGTEGRNLQFCHHLVNFDLPWNPMEIEQRIGRLHRLGQRYPVRIFNFVQEGTLQEHLLAILQEKLNLFELVVGETGLVLGERLSGDEFEEEVYRRWHENQGRVAEAIATLGTELAEARDRYHEVKQLDDTLFAQDFET